MNMLKRLLPLLALGLLCACSPQNAAPARPCDLEELGYCLDLSAAPAVLQQELEQHASQELLLEGLQGSYRSLCILVYGPISAEPEPAMVLQALPAGTTEIQLGEEILPVADWAPYLVYENEDLLLYDLYPLVCGEESLPQRLEQQRAERQLQLRQKLKELLSPTLPDDSAWRDLSFGLSCPSETLYTDYLWAYVHEHLSELVKESA